MSYQISELAEQAGLPPATLRFYEQSGLLPAARAANGYRRYGDDALARLALIRAGKQLGLPLAQIRDLLAVRDAGVCADVRERLRPLLAARIAQARQQVAGLDDSIARLEEALAGTDPPPVPGPCDPDCGCLTEPAPPQSHQAPQPHQALQPYQSYKAGQPLACTLTGEDQGARMQAWRDLIAQGTAREPVADGIRVTLPAALAGPAAELAVAEQRCCPFFRFTLVFDGSDVQLTVQAPPEAGPFLSEITDEPAAPVSL